MVLTNNELRGSPDVLVVFLQKIFGPSIRAKQASGVLRAISSVGHVVSFTYSHVKGNVPCLEQLCQSHSNLSLFPVKQEIARMGILPFPEYFARSTADGIPGPALLLHFVLSAIVIVAVPASQTSLVFSILYSFSRTWVSGMLSLEKQINHVLITTSFAGPWLIICLALKDISTRKRTMEASIISSIWEKFI